MVTGMRRSHVWILVALLALGLWLWAQPRAPSLPAPAPDHSGSVTTPAATPSALPRTSTGAASGVPAFLPAEARDVLQRIAQGGPFEHRQDGSVFQNREHRLPPQPRGYYHEYTVETPGSSDRGARRIITGGMPPSDYWYTDDHYRSFQHFEATPLGGRP